MHPQQQPTHFCFLMIRTIPVSIFSYGYIAVVLLFSYLMLVQVKSLIADRLYSKVSFIFILLFVWSFVTVLQVAYFQYMYYFIGKVQKSTYDDQMNIRLSDMSFVACFSTYFIVFVLHSALIQVPYILHSNVIEIYAQHRTLLQALQSAQPINQIEQDKCDHIFSKFIYLYSWMRFISIIGWVVYSFVFVLAGDDLQRNWYAQQTFHIVLIDSIIILILFLISLTIVNNNHQLKKLVGKQFIKLTNLRYYFAIAATILRIIVFYIRNPDIGLPNLRSRFLTKKCQIELDYDKTRYFIFVVIEVIFLDFLPAYILYRIYKKSRNS